MTDCCLVPPPPVRALEPARCPRSTPHRASGADRAGLFRQQVQTAVRQLWFCILFTWQGCSTTRSDKPSLSGRCHSAPLSKSGVWRARVALHSGIILSPVLSSVERNPFLIGNRPTERCVAGPRPGPCYNPALPRGRGPFGGRSGGRSGGRGWEDCHHGRYRATVREQSPLGGRHPEGRPRLLRSPGPGAGAEVPVDRLRRQPRPGR